MTERLTDDQIREAFRRSQGRCQCPDCTGDGLPAALWAQGPNGRMPVVLDAELAAQHLGADLGMIASLATEQVIPYVDVQLDAEHSVRFFRVADLDAFLEDEADAEAFQ